MTATIHRLPKREVAPDVRAIRECVEIFKKWPPELLALAKNAIRQANRKPVMPWDRQHTVDSLLMTYVATGVLLGASIDAIIATLPPYKPPAA